jgi:hypothetical protein
MHAMNVRLSSGLNLFFNPAATQHLKLTTEKMLQRKIKQWQCESDSWKRLLGFMLEENAYLKGRLSDLLKKEIDLDLLDTLETFQNRFVREDELISLLRDEVTELDKLLIREMFEDGNIIKLTEKKFRKVKGNIETTEKAFAKLFQDFDNYVLETLPVKSKVE